MSITIEKARHSETLNDSSTEKRLSVYLSWKKYISILFDFLLFCVLIIATVYFYHHRSEMLTQCVNVAYTRACNTWLP
jgi:uncharacterized membrane protein